MDELYNDIPEQQDPLYNADDTVPTINTTVGNYPIMKGIVTVATGKVDAPDEVNFDQYVDSNWRNTAPALNNMDRDVAVEAAANNNPDLVATTLEKLRVRNEMMGQESSNKVAQVRAKLKELSSQAVENASMADQSVLINNTPQEIAAVTERSGSVLSAQATLEKAMEDGKKWSNILSGIGYEFIPLAAEQGAAIDRVAIKYGVPPEAVSRADGRSKTVTYLQAAFEGTPDEDKGEWLAGLYQDLQDGFFISDWQAALVVQEVATGADKTWGGWEDWLDRLGVVGTVVSGGFALLKSANLLKGAKAINNVERTIAAAGGKNAVLSAETAKIATAVANKQRIQAAGVVVGELTGVNAALDLAKLVSVSATKVLPESITVASAELQKPIRKAVDTLIADLQSTIAAKGVRAEEAALELENLQRFYSKASNPNIHSVDNFVMAADGTSITGKVFYKPQNASSFMTEDAAKAYIATLDPTGSKGLKAIPDTTNTGFLVEENVKKELQLRKTALEAQVLERIAEAGKPRKAKKTADAPVSVDLSVAAPPNALVTSKPRWKTFELAFQDDIDKAAYQVGSKSKPSKSDQEVKEWLQAVTGWNDAQVAAHATKVRNSIKGIENTADERNVINVNVLPQEGKASIGTPKEYEAGFKMLKEYTGNVTVGNVTVTSSVPKNFVFEFVNKVGKALGMENREIVVIQLQDMMKSKDPIARAIVDRMATHPSAGAVHFDMGKGKSAIVMRTQLSTTTNLRQYIETFAHEYGHAFESEFGTKYFGVINASFNKWLRAKGIKYTGEGVNKKLLDKFSPEALLEFRSITNAQELSKWVENYANGDVKDFKNYEAQAREWATSYSEFFAENFAKWAFTDEVPTTILGQAFKKLVDGFKLIASEVNERLAALGVAVDIGRADRNITAMLNEHVRLVKEQVPQMKAQMAIVGKESKSIRPTVATLTKELEEVTEQLQAIEDAEKGLKTGWLVEQPISRKLDYSIIGKYTDEDIDSASRFSMGDWALATSSELYSQRVVGINQQSRYQKLLTNFVRPSIEKLSASERSMLDAALVLGDKEGKVFAEAELAGMDMSVRAREAYYRVRALRDIMYQMRNDVAVKSLTRRGYVQLDTGLPTDEGGSRIFAKPVEVQDGKYVYLSDTNTMQRMGSEFREEATKQGYIFFEAAEPVLIDGKYRKTFAFKEGGYAQSKITEAIPYRAGEYRRIYSDEYFVKVRAAYEVDGEIQEVVTTHRTAASMGDAKAYVKALEESQRLYKAGKLTPTEAARLMQPFGWQPEELIGAFVSGRFGDDFKLDVKFTRTDDDYVQETIGLSSNYSSKRGDKVLSVHGEDTVNTLNPLDAIASEIGNTAYVASVTEWKESHVIRWFNSFQDDLPINVQSMTPDQAFVYMLNNKGMYVGDNKRLQVAEKVQDYIISQMNIPTKEEKAYLGFMRMLSETVEGKTGGGAMHKVGAALRSTVNYPTWARTIAFHSFFAFNPVQLFMQGMNAFNAVAISPLHGLKSARASSLYALALFSDQEDIWRNVAKVNKLTSLGLGMEADEFVEVVRAIRRTGILDGINTTSLYGAEVGKFGILNKPSRIAGEASAGFFNAGEGYSRLVSFDIARREWMEANPGGAWWTDDALAKIIERQDDLTQNMTIANTASWQQGWKSIPTQFIQYQVKLMMNIIQSLLGNKRVFTQQEALRLLVTHTLVMGTAGNFLWPFRDLITENIPEDMSEEARLYVQQGVVAGMIGSVTDGEAKLALGSRFNTFRYYEDLVKGLLDPEKTFMEVAGGPSGFAALRIFGGFGEALSIITAAPMTMDSLQTALSEIGKGSFSFLNNIQKYRIATANYNQVISGRGGAMFRVTDTEAFLLAFGIPPAAQEDLSVMFESSKAQRDDISSAAKSVGKHSLLAITALRNNDQEGYKTHSAVVHAIINSYNGADRKRLYTEAYKVEAFTQYEKLLVDQAVKDWTVQDIIVDTGANQ